MRFDRRFMAGATAALLAVAYAACGGTPQIAQTASSRAQGVDVAWTPLPDFAGMPAPSTTSHVPKARKNHDLLYLDSGSAVNIYALTGPNGKQVGSISYRLYGPWGLSVDSNNSLYVANSKSGDVLVYNSGSTTPSMTYSHVIREPLYALADSSGHVFVSGINPPRRDRNTRGVIVEYNAGTNVVIARKTLGTEVDGIAVDGQGNLYAAYRGTGHSSIAKFGPGLTNKQHLRMVINQPQGLLLDSSGNLVVAESTIGDIKVFPPGSTTPSITLNVENSTSRYIGNLAELAMQSDEKTLWVSTEDGQVFWMPYPLTPSTVPAEYEAIDSFSNGLAVTNAPT